jgi:hypothetical protein
MHRTEEIFMPTPGQIVQLLTIQEPGGQVTLAAAVVTGTGQVVAGRLMAPADGGAGNMGFVPDAAIELPGELHGEVMLDAGGRVQEQASGPVTTQGVPRVG